MGCRAARRLDDFRQRGLRRRCVFVRSYLAGYLRLDSVILAPGWTYVVQKNGEGTSSRVELQFTQTATGNKVDFRVEFGKTRIG